MPVVKRPTSPGSIWQRPDQVSDQPEETRKRETRVSTSPVDSMSESGSEYDVTSKAVWTTASNAPPQDIKPEHSTSKDKEKQVSPSYLVSTEDEIAAVDKVMPKTDDTPTTLQEERQREPPSEFIATLIILK